MVTSAPAFDLSASSCTCCFVSSESGLAAASCATTSTSTSSLDQPDTSCLQAEHSFLLLDTNNVQYGRLLVLDAIVVGLVWPNRLAIELVLYGRTPPGLMVSILNEPTATAIEALGRLLYR